MKLVLDASVALKWLLAGEPDASLAENLLKAARTGRVNLLSPPHAIAEILAVLARREPDRLPDALAVLYDVGFVESSGRRVHQLAAILSVQLDHHLFDTLYHAVAIDAGATLITADERYFGKARALGHIELLRTFQLP